MTIDSFSSCLIYGNTQFRNQPGIVNKIVAEVAYLSIVVIGAAEAITALAITILVSLTYPFTEKPLEHCVIWLSSSAFSLGWSFSALFINPIASHMIPDEYCARMLGLNMFHDLLGINQEATLTEML